jgi:hypothetical protein
LREPSRRDTPSKRDGDKKVIFAGALRRNNYGKVLMLDLQVRLRHPRLGVAGKSHSACVERKAS